MAVDNSGFISQDTLQIGTQKIPRQDFAEITKMPRMQKDASFDGVFGLGLINSAVAGAVPPFYRMLEERLITQPVFSILLRDKEISDGGEITFGAIKHTNYIGDISWEPIVGSKYWTLRLRAGYVGDSQVTIQAEFAILDTGTSVILMPDEDADAMNRLIGAKKSITSQMETVDCAKRGLLPDVQFNFGGRNYTLTSNEYILKYPSGDICYSAFAKLPKSYWAFSKYKATKRMFQNVWVVGVPFLKKFYSIYDLGNRRVGLARAR